MKTADDIKNIAAHTATIKLIMNKSNKSNDTEKPVDLVEQTVEHAHVVIPIVGAVLIFLMAFVAILSGAPNGTWS